MAVSGSSSRMGSCGVEPLGRWVGGIRMSTITRSGTVPAHDCEQRGCVAGLVDHPEAGALEQARHALAQQRVIVRDHDLRSIWSHCRIIDTLARARMPARPLDACAGSNG